jgi:hypothetical protein
VHLIPQEVARGYVHDIIHLFKDPDSRIRRMRVMRVKMFMRVMRVVRVNELRGSHYYENSDC